VNGHVLTKNDGVFVVVMDLNVRIGVVLGRDGTVDPFDLHTAVLELIKVDKVGSHDRADTGVLSLIQQSYFSSYYMGKMGKTAAAAAAAWWKKKQTSHQLDGRSNYVLVPISNHKKKRSE
jgi:hypothetical protein